MNSSVQGQATQATPRFKALRNIGVLLAGLVIGVVALNVAVAAPLEGVIYPGVSIGGQSLAFKTRAQAFKQVKAMDARHALTIKLASKTYYVGSDELGASRDVAASVEAAYQIGRTTPYPLVGVLSSMRSGQAGFAYRLDTIKLGNFVSKITTEIGKAPVNAKVEVVDGAVVAVPDQDGVSINQEELGHTLQQALAEGRDKSVSLEPSLVKADILLETTDATVAEAKAIMTTNIALNYNDKSFAPSKETIASWLVFPTDKDSAGKPIYKVALDEARVRGYVQTIANEVNIAPVSKKVTIKNGVSTTDEEGKDGLAINQDEAVRALMDAASKQKALAFGLTTTPVAFKTQYNRVTTLDVGRYIEINLSTQHLWVYQDSNVIYESPVTSGATGAGFPTVTGLFSIYAKARNTHLIGYQYGPQYNYDVLVDYWMPFYGGFGLHDAWRWRTTFGGPDYYYNGSHGCVNLPLETAAFIYNWSDIGTPVWVHT